MRKNALSEAIKSTFGITAALLAGLPGVGSAQPAEPIEEVIVTGSSIKRMDLESALPIQVISKDDIAKSGVTNVGDLIEKIPSMQGFTTVADSVGGDGGGLETANLRDLGEQYTLVLLNGRRLAPADSGSTIDLSNIPLGAIERVEVLKDGASALYGSDAIAGVVNFILKDSVEETTVSVRRDDPREPGGESWSFDLSTGFGNISENGFSTVFTYSHREQKQLAAVDRDFADTGMIQFSDTGFNQPLFFFNGSGNSIPGNALVKYKRKNNDGSYALDKDGEQIIDTSVLNPYLKQNGACPENTSLVKNENGDECWFDYTSTIEIVPESERDSFFGRVNFNVSDNIQGFASALYSNTQITARMAPYPTGYVPLDMGSSLVSNNVFPYLTVPQADVTAVQGRWRALPASNRVTEYDKSSYNLVAGIDGSIDSIDFSAGITHSLTEIEENYPDGWLYRDRFVDLVGRGAINIFSDPSDFTEADRNALAPAIYHGHWQTQEIIQNTIDGKASMPVFEMEGGEMQVALGFDYRNTQYDRSISEANANAELLFLSKDTEYEMERDQFGIFTEAVLPITHTVELTGSLRYDRIGAVEDKRNGGDINKSDDDVTYKVTAHWAALETLSFRASYGTGFKAPSMREIGEPLSEFGVTGGSYSCPFESTDPMAQYCLTGETQYDVFRKGDASLKPEKSTQYSFGFVLTPTDDFSATVDYWNIEMEDLVERLEEKQIFNNPVLYRDLFTTKTNLATGDDRLAIIRTAVNVGTSENSGIDYAFEKSFELPFGELKTGLSGTYFIESESSLTGSSLGKFGEDQSVTFRNMSALSVVLEHGDFSHSFLVNYRSGYSDAETNVNLIGDNGELGDKVKVRLEIPSYTTVTYQSQFFALDEQLVLTLGVNNLFDRQPPLVLSDGAGHQLGYDPRFTDSYGRTLYMQADYSF